MAVSDIKRGFTAQDWLRMALKSPNKVSLTSAHINTMETLRYRTYAMGDKMNENRTMRKITLSTTHGAYFDHFKVFHEFVVFFVGGE